jgi:hypothetical protein
LRVDFLVGLAYINGKREGGDGISVVKLVKE